MRITYMLVYVRVNPSCFIAVWLPDQVVVATSPVDVCVCFLCYNRKAEVEQEPQETKQARNLKSATFTRAAQQHH